MIRPEVESWDGGGKSTKLKFLRRPDDLWMVSVEGHPNIVLVGERNAIQLRALERVHFAETGRWPIWNSVLKNPPSLMPTVI